MNDSVLFSSQPRQAKGCWYERPMWCNHDRRSEQTHPVAQGRGGEKGNLKAAV
jgi:hypothetical protein